MIKEIIKKLDRDFLTLLSPEKITVFPEIPTGALNAALQKVFARSDVSLVIGNGNWQDHSTRPPENAQKWFKISNLPGAGAIGIAPQELGRLAHHILNIKLEQGTLFHPTLTEAALTFAVIKGAQAVKTAPPYQKLSFELEPPHELPSGMYYEIPFECRLGDDENLHATLHLSAALFQALRDFFHSDNYLMETLSKTTSLPLKVILGYTTLHETELYKLQEGDFILLDESYYHPKKNKGFFKLVLSETPLFELKFREGRWKIFDHIIDFQEMRMDEEFEEESEQQLPEAFEEEVGEKRSGPSLVKKVALREVPVKIDFEVGRFETTLEKLEAMQPGDFLPLDFEPTRVDLVIGNRLIGRGEFIEVGDVVGIKIIELNR
ncbi:MAG: hypothetical protein A3F09_01555 [Chlamydiae bacterium RIFCSPHIGHO2_12_FULL_49_11]|nr:MAG: hypothetical protein A3F09_01555 [Chlamydiae bacterium RIFCSPHIGHO2_12_FULL_49_11]